MILRDVLGFRLLLILLLLLGGKNLYCQLAVSQASAAQMVDYLIDDESGTIEFDPASIVFSGSATMLGRFSNGDASGMDVDTGIIMSTGKIQNAVGPNNDEGQGGNGSLNLNGTSLLNPLIGGEETFDAAVLRFKFRVFGDKVSFNYVFASEEYNEYVGSEFNDAFAFFISGPGITGNYNMAITPVSGDPVSVNTINLNTNNNLYYNNDNGGPSSAAIQYDGFTRRLTASKNALQSCQWYTLTLVIADVSDDLWDSAVFLEAGSMKSSTPVMFGQTVFPATSAVINNYTIAYENCGNMNLVFQIEGDAPSQVTNYPLQISGTATAGIDYQTINNSITLQAGQTQASIPIIILADGVNEPGGETINITYNKQTCSGIEPITVSFTIMDPATPLTIAPINPINYDCPRIATELEAVISGGAEPYLVVWEGFMPGQNPVTVVPEQTTTYTVNVNDRCGNTASLDAQIIIDGYIPLALNPQPTHAICKGDSVLIGADAEGGKAPVTYFWQGFADLSSVLYVGPSSSTTYVLYATDACGISVNRNITVNVNEVNAQFDLRYTDQRTIQFIDQSYDNVTDWFWDFGDGDGFSNETSPLYTYPDTGFYDVTLYIEDANACRDSTTQTIYAYPPYALWIPNAFTPDGDGLNDFFTPVGQGFSSFEFWVFNRWGETIFYTDRYGEAWGLMNRYDNLDFQDGVYAYRVITQRPTLKKQEYIGRITLLH